MAMTSHLRTKQGISLIETMIALSILAIGLLAMLAAQIMALQQGNEGRHTTEAAQIATDQMELLSRLPWADPAAQPTAGWTAPLVVARAVQSPAAPPGGFIEQQFNLQWRITASPINANLRTVDVRVLWTESNQPAGAPPRRFAISSAKYNPS